MKMTDSALPKPGSRAGRSAAAALCSDCCRRKSGRPSPSSESPPTEINSRRENESHNRPCDPNTENIAVAPKNVYPPKRNLLTTQSIEYSNVYAGVYCSRPAGHRGRKSTVQKPQCSHATGKLLVTERQKSQG